MTDTSDVIDTIDIHMFCVYVCVYVLHVYVCVNTCSRFSLFFLRYFRIMSVFIQLVPRDQWFGVDALTSIFYIASSKHKGKFSIWLIESTVLNVNRGINFSFLQFFCCYCGGGFVSYLVFFFLFFSLFLLGLWHILL